MGYPTKYTTPFRAVPVSYIEHSQSLEVSLALIIIYIKKNKCEISKKELIKGNFVREIKILRYDPMR